MVAEHGRLSYDDSACIVCCRERDTSCLNMTAWSFLEYRVLKQHCVLQGAGIVQRSGLLLKAASSVTKICAVIASGKMSSPSASNIFKS